MAANTYGLATASFGGDAINSVKSATIEKTGTPTDLSADSSRVVNKVIVDEKTVNISVTTMDQSQRFRAGSNGTLVLTTVERTAGDGVSDGTTITIPNCVCLGAEATKETQTEGTLTINFRAYDNNADWDTSMSLISYQ